MLTVVIGGGGIHVLEQVVTGSCIVLADHAGAGIEQQIQKVFAGVIPDFIQDSVGDGGALVGVGDVAVVCVGEITAGIVVNEGEAQGFFVVVGHPFAVVVDGPGFRMAACVDGTGVVLAHHIEQGIVVKDVEEFAKDVEEEDKFLMELPPMSTYVILGTDLSEEF